MRFRCVLLIALLSLSSTSRAQSPEEWFGIWKLNLAESIYNPGPGPYARATMKVEPWQDGIRFSYDLVRPRGGVQHMEWTGKFDGMDYMVQGVDDYVTYAYRALGDRAFEVVTKLDGRIAAVSKVTLSADGRRLTTTTGGKNPRGEDVTNVTVYEKTSPLPR